MKKLALFAFIALYSFSFTLPAAAINDCDCETESDLEEIGRRANREIFRLTNEERKSEGLPPLELDRGACQEMAERHAKFGAKFSLKGDLGHLNFKKRVEAFGLGGKRVSEIVVYMGASSGVAPERAMRLWMNSSAHRKEILNDRNRKVGIGTAKDAQGNTYWVQCFTD